MSDRGGASLPGEPNYVPGLPSNFRPQAFEGFTGLNTKVPRAVIRDTELAWCDGFIPLGSGTAEDPYVLQTLPGTGSPIFSATGGRTVVWFSFGNIGSALFLVALLSDGSIQTQAGQIAPPGTVQSPSTFFGFSQWGSQYLIFANAQTNGYWLWDGSLFYQAGGVGPQVTIDNAGSGYTSLPAITSQTTGGGGGDAYQAVLTNGSVSQVMVTNPGTGYAVGDFIALRFHGGGSNDQAQALLPTITTNAGGVDSVFVIAGGNTYTSRTNVTVVGGSGSGATISLSIQNGTITGAAVVNPGSGYTSPPNLIINDPGIPGSTPIPPGTGGILGCSIALGQITAIGISNGGSGYGSPPTVKIVGDGTGATAVAILSGQSVVSIQMLTMGKGYTKALAILQGGNASANATVILMPFGISGTTVEVFQQHVWVSNGGATSNTPPRNRTIFSSANSPVDFSGSGGAFASTDSFLRVGCYSLKQANGFLYLIGDSSLNYISGVQTTSPTGATAAPATTTFGNQNVDPQLGSPWPSSVQVFSRNIVFGNPIGVYVSYGGAVTKASTPLDGFYDSGPAFVGGANFSSAVGTIFNIPVYMLLLPVVDTFTGLSVNKLLMWDGKHWFTSQQDRSLTYIATQEINSTLQAWGTDGTNVFQMFVNPSVGFAKVAQSKLFSGPAYWTTKTAQSVGGVLQTFTVDQPVSISLDNENGVGTGNAVVSVTPTSGLEVFGPLPVGQQGRMIGFTIQTNASNLEVLSVTATEKLESPNV